MSSLNLINETLKVTPTQGEIEFNGQFHATDNNSSRAQMQRLVLETSKSATGTAVDFPNIPSWVKRITVMLKDVSTNGTTSPIIQLGTGGTPTTSGYVGSSTRLQGTSLATNVYAGSGFSINVLNIATSVMSGAVTISLLESNTWVATGIVSGTGTNLQHTTAGHVDLSGTLDFVRITSAGPDTFDSGTINILYEG